MNEDTKFSIREYSELLIDCFFELFSEGLLSDETFERGIESSGSFKKVKKFRGIDSSCMPDVSCIENGIIYLEVTEKIIEKLNNYFCGISLENLSEKFADFDEEISEDNFLRTVEKIPVSSPLFDFFYQIWKCTFEQLSCFEKSISFANNLHLESARKISEHYDLVQDNINTANAIVDKLNKQIYGDENTVGLAQKVKETEEKIGSIKNEVQSTTVTILGIFAAIVLAFSGVFSFSSSIMQNMGNVSIYRLIGVSAVLGLVTFNLIFCLMTYLLIETKKVGTSSIKYPFLPLWITDALLVVLLILVCLAWANDWLTKSPNDITKPTPTNTIASTQENRQEERTALIYLDEDTVMFFH